MKSLRSAAPPFLLALALLPGCAVPSPAPQATAAGPSAASPVAIGAIQGHAAQSPRIGEEVFVEGVVTWMPADAGGGFVQDGGDGDDATSDALFVVTGDTLREGERVRVRGRVAELAVGDGATRTALVDAQVQALGKGRIAPLALSAPPSDWERLEGMRVRLAAPLSLAESDPRRPERTLAAFGRLWQPTERAAPGSEEARAIAAANAQRRLWLEAAPALAPAWTQALASARSGSRLTAAEGVLDQDGAGYRLLLSTLPTLQPAPRPQPPQVAGNLRVAALNLENLFNGDGHGGGFPTPRGARTPAELAAQLSKHAATIRALDPDLVALMELENDGYGADSSLAALVAALNTGGGDWRYVDAGQGPGDNPIRVGLIYRSSRVRPQGGPATLEEGPFGPHSRVPLAQAFVPLRGGRADGPAFVVVANHFKSKGCSGAEGQDRDLGDGAACWNATRTDSARRLDAWLKTDPTGAGSDLTLIVGDLNAYAQEAPLQLLTHAGWRDAFAVIGAETPYSYVYRGELGRLDHALLSPALAARLRGAAEWHSNADEPETSGYRAGGRGPWRSSDHDPLLLGFDL